MSEQLVKRLRELSNAVTRADWNEFSMRIPVEKDRDADFVLLQAADKIEALEADAARMDWIQKNLLCADWEYPQGEKKTQPVICISWPASVGISGNLRSSIDGAMKGGA
mgnify:FL=1